MQHQPEQPSKAEVREHNLTHVPYMSWCHHCIRGRAVNDQHQKKREEEKEREREQHALTTVAIDYAYLNHSNDETTEGLNRPNLA